jgi:hypothetical protein
MTEKHTHDDPDLHQMLQDLPSLRAPDSLIGNVMATISQRQVAWYRRPASTWPLSLQLGFTFGSIAVLAALVWLATGWLPAFNGIELRELLVAPIARIVALFGTLETLIRATSLVGRMALGPAVLVIVAACSALYLAVFGLSTALWRTFARSSH